MIKKRYLMILSLTIVSVLLGSLLYNHLVLAGKPVPETQPIEITNFPLDEEGNLRISSIQTSEIRLVFNETVTVSSDLNTYNYLTSFNTSGYAWAHIMAKGEPDAFQEGANVYICFADNNWGVQTEPFGSLYLTLQTSEPNIPISYGTGRRTTEIHSTSKDLYLRVYNSNIGFDGLLTIIVHLTN